MATVYVVVENGELYPVIYKTYESARSAVTAKYVVELAAEREEVEEMDDTSYCMASDVDIDENESGTTQLYIEKGINIIIQRYNVPR
jgi:archaellum component FlaF (FlaF/FlaG flagellin family)